MIQQNKIIKLSLIVTVFNEEQNIAPLTSEIQNALEKIDYEVIFVDDASTDNTVKEILKITNDRFVLLELKRNYGQSTAIQAGIDYASGEFIALIDGDLQNDPADLPRMMEMMEKEEWDMVAGVRSSRKDHLISRKLPSKTANYFIRKITGVNIKDMGCTLKIFTNETIKNVNIYGELHRFIPVLIALEGAVKITQTEVNHRPRIHGTSKYDLRRTIPVISDLILMLFFKKYMQRPMHLFGGLGLLFFGVGAVINIYLLCLKLLNHDIWGKPLLLLGILLVLGGIQFITIGIIAELQMRTYFETQNKKTYRVKRSTKL